MVDGIDNNCSIVRPPYGAHWGTCSSLLANGTSCSFQCYNGYTSIPSTITCHNGLLSSFGECMALSSIITPLSMNQGDGVHINDIQWYNGSYLFIDTLMDFPTTPIPDTILPFVRLRARVDMVKSLITFMILDGDNRLTINTSATQIINDASYTFCDNNGRDTTSISIWLTFSYEDTVMYWLNDTLIATLVTNQPFLFSLTHINIVIGDGHASLPTFTYTPLTKLPSLNGRFSSNKIIAFIISYLICLLFFCCAFGI
jgi:hypothetical protein